MLYSRSQVYQGYQAHVGNAQKDAKELEGEDGVTYYSTYSWQALDVDSDSDLVNYACPSGEIIHRYFILSQKYNLHCEIFSISPQLPQAHFRWALKIYLGAQTVISQPGIFYASPR